MMSIRTLLTVILAWAAGFTPTTVWAQEPEPADATRAEDPGGDPLVDGSGADLPGQGLPLEVGHRDPGLPGRPEQPTQPAGPTPSDVDPLDPAPVGLQELQDRIDPVDQGLGVGAAVTSKQHRETKSRLRDITLMRLDTRATSCESASPLSQLMRELDTQRIRPSLEDG